MKTLKRSLALILTLVFVLGLMPAGVLADPEEPAPGDVVLVAPSLTVTASFDADDGYAYDGKPTTLALHPTFSFDPDVEDGYTYTITGVEVTKQTDEYLIDDERYAKGNFGSAVFTVKVDDDADEKDCVTVSTDGSEQYGRMTAKVTGTVTATVEEAEVTKEWTAELNVRFQGMSSIPTQPFDEPDEPDEPDQPAIDEERARLIAELQRIVNTWAEADALEINVEDGGNLPSIYHWYGKDMIADDDALRNSYLQAFADRYDIEDSDEVERLWDEEISWAEYSESYEYSIVDLTVDGGIVEAYGSTSLYGLAEGTETISGTIRITSINKMWYCDIWDYGENWDESEEIDPIELTFSCAVKVVDTRYVGPETDVQDPETGEYLSLSDAIAYLAEEGGEEISLRRWVKLKDDLTIPAGVTVHLSGYNLEVPTGITLTVEGRISDNYGARYVDVQGGTLEVKNGGCIESAVRVTGEDSVVNVNDSAWIEYLYDEGSGTEVTVDSSRIYELRVTGSDAEVTVGEGGEIQYIYDCGTSTALEISGEVSNLYVFAPKATVQSVGGKIGYLYRNDPSARGSEDQYPMQQDKDDTIVLNGGRVNYLFVGGTDYYTDSNNPASFRLIGPEDGYLTGWFGFDPKPYAADGLRKDKRAASYEWWTPYTAKPRADVVVRYTVPGVEDDRFTFAEWMDGGFTLPTFDEPVPMDTAYWHLTIGENTISIPVFGAETDVELSEAFDDAIGALLVKENRSINGANGMPAAAVMETMDLATAEKLAYLELLSDIGYMIGRDQDYQTLLREWLFDDVFYDTLDEESNTLVLTFNYFPRVYAYPTSVNYDDGFVALGNLLAVNVVREDYAIDVTANVPASTQINSLEALRAYRVPAAPTNPTCHQASGGTIAVSFDHWSTVIEGKRITLQPGDSLYDALVANGIDPQLFFTTGGLKLTAVWGYDLEVQYSYMSTDGKTTKTDTLTARDWVKNGYVLRSAPADLEVPEGLGDGAYFRWRLDLDAILDVIYGEPEEHRHQNMGGSKQEFIGELNDDLEQLQYQQLVELGIVPDGGTDAMAIGFAPGRSIEGQLWDTVYSDAYNWLPLGALALLHEELRNQDNDYNEYDIARLKAYYDNAYARSYGEFEDTDALVEYLIATGLPMLAEQLRRVKNNGDIKFDDASVLNLTDPDDLFTVALGFAYRFYLATCGDFDLLYYCNGSQLPAVPSLREAQSVYDTALREMLPRALELGLLAYAPTTGYLPLVGEWVDEGVVSIDREDEDPQYFTSVKKAVKKAEDGDTIRLAVNGLEEPLDIGVAKALQFVGGEKTLAGDVTVTTGSLTIESGTFTGDVDVFAGGLLVIRDGAFTGTLTARGNGRIELQGGHYTNRPSDDYVAAGCIIRTVTTEEGDTLYQIVPGVAAITRVNEKGLPVTTFYDTVEDAIAAAADGDTIQVNKDVALAETPTVISKDLTFRSYGEPVKTLTGDIEVTDGKEIVLNHVILDGDITSDGGDVTLDHGAACDNVTVNGDGDVTVNHDSEVNGDVTITGEGRVRVKNNGEVHGNIEGNIDNGTGDTEAEPRTVTVTVTEIVYVPVENSEDVNIEDEEVPLADLPLLFIDVNESDWFYDAVASVYDRGLMIGITEDIFDPYGLATRGMIATVLYRMAGSPAVEGTMTFADAADAYYSNAVLWGAENEILKGYDSEHFLPGEYITREQLVTFLYRYALSLGCEIDSTGDLSAFNDAENVSDFAAEAMQWAVSVGLIYGNDNQLNPGSNAMRAEIAAIIYRFVENFLETPEETAA